VAAELKAMKLKDAAQKVEDSVEGTLAHCGFPSERWTQIRTNDVIERSDREIRRRNYAGGFFSLALYRGPPFMLYYKDSVKNSAGAKMEREAGRMDLTERTVSSQTLFEGKIVKLTLDEVLLPDGKPARREVVYHPGGVGVLALDGENNVTLVRQYRYPIGRVLLEVPAGKLDHGAEDALLGAKRELSEETGLEAEEWTYLGYTLASPGFCDEALHMYLARGLRRARSHPDEDEFLDVVTMPFDELVRQVMDGTIADAKTVALTLKTKVLLGL